MSSNAVRWGVGAIAGVGVLTAVTVAGPSGARYALRLYVAASAAAAVQAALRAIPGLRPETIAVSVGSSSALARQISQGAPADVFISAHPRWMNYVARQGRIDGGSRIELLRGSLVLLTRKGSRLRAPATASARGILGHLAGGRVAIGDPGHVPVGIYSRQALRSLGLWRSLRPRLVFAPSARSVVALVARGEVAAGIGYRSDAALDPGLEIAATFSPRSHAAVTYPAAAVRGRASARARRLLGRLRGPEAIAAFRASGFEVPAPSSAGGR